MKNLARRSHRRVSKPTGGGRGVLAGLLVLGLSSCSYLPSEFPSLSGWYDSLLGDDEDYEVIDDRRDVMAPLPQRTAGLRSPYAPPAAYAPPSPYGAAPYYGAAAPYGAGNTLAEAYARSLAESAPTMTTAPATATFAAPSAQRLPLNLSGTVPPVVLETYNEALSQSAAPAQAADGAAVQFAGLAGNVVVYFADGSARLSAADRRKINGLAQEYRRNGGRVHVLGHASSRTRELTLARHKLVNLRISVDRSNAVTRELMRLGVRADDIVSESRSDADPVYFEVMPSGEAGNRRVEISLR